MLSQEELRLLRDTLRRNHVESRLVALGELQKEIGEGLGGLSEGGRPDFRPAWRTVYRAEDRMGLCHTLLSLPTGEILLIGPYLGRALSREERLELWERAEIPPQAQKNLHEYYDSLAILPLGDRLFVMLDSFCESLWETPAFSVVELDQAAFSLPGLAHDAERAEDFDAHLMHMHAMETRYAFENELMRAVTLGQIQKQELLSTFSAERFEKRASDPIRNLQNYDIIMNTLLRKAAEKAGVHPIHLDRVSSAFAKRIEELSEGSANLPLMKEMFRAYCRLVRKHAIRHYSLPVQKTVLLIDADLSAELAPRALAQAQGLSLGYLSSLFHKEVGVTISEYIRERRMKHAAHLLSTTRLQIQTVAQHCGIMDVQYFSKTFKKAMGMTPKEYRERASEAHG
ncbi:MAG: helix-turn-helix transcriptional regulator [Clostridia bacterium]|nr:helix-turn-helix transcriptional regulator [Clostridia bacterium]